MTVGKGVALAVGLLLAGCALAQATVTMEEYLRIENGMSYGQVVEIIGSEGQEMARNQVQGVAGVMPSTETVMYMWQNSDGSGMNAMFQNDALVQKAQFGLR